MGKLRALWRGSRPGTRRSPTNETTVKFRFLIPIYCYGPPWQPALTADRWEPGFSTAARSGDIDVLLAGQ